MASEVKNWQPDAWDSESSSCDSDVPEHWDLDSEVADSDSCESDLFMDKPMGDNFEGSDGVSTSDPWTDVTVGHAVKGTIIEVCRSGYLVEIGAIVPAWLPYKLFRRNVTWPDVGDEISGFISWVDAGREWIWLQISPLRCTHEDLVHHMKHGTHLVGRIASLQSYGVFVDVGAHVNGLVHRSELPTLKFEAGLKVGDQLMVRVLEVDGPKGLKLSAFIGPWLAARRPKVPVHLGPIQLMRHPITMLQLPPGIVSNIVGQLSLACLRSLARAAKPLQHVADEAASIFWDVRSLRCFHTRAAYNEADTVLGVGVSIHEERGIGTTKKHLTCDFDLVSKEAYYKLGVGRGAQMQRIQFWLPLAICESHFNRGFTDLRQVLDQFANDKVAQVTKSHGPRAIRSGNVRPEDMLTLDEFRKRQEALRAYTQRQRAKKKENLVRPTGNRGEG